MGQLLKVHNGERVGSMGAFGERLRREREMRGISLNEISESTKISRRHLESLENEDFDSLPGGVFNRGFVRAYARFVGINEEQAVADYNAVCKEPEPAPDQFPLEVHIKPDRELNPKGSPLPLILAVAALVGFIVVVWARNRSHQPEAATAVAPSQSASAPSPSGEVPSPTAAEPSPSPEVPSPSAASPTPNGDWSGNLVSTPSPNVVPPAQPTAPAQPAVPAQPAAPASVSPTAAYTKVAGNAAPAPSPGHTFVIVVRAKEDSWISLVADGKTSWEGILKANKQHLVRAGRRVVLTTGNAGGIVVSHNGKVLRALGSESEVRTLTFNHAGLVQ